MRSTGSFASVQMNIICIAGLVLCTSTCVLGQLALSNGEREFGAISLLGINKPAHVTPLSNQTPIGFELRYSHLHAEQQSWEQCQCFYRSGVFINAYSFRNPTALGQSIGAGLFFEPILVQGPKLELSVRALAGIAYVSRHYDVITNPGNMAFGTSFNGLIGVGFYGRYQLAPSWRLLTGIDYKHLSNAGIRLPNEGLNVPALSVGIMRYIGVAKLADIRYRIPSAPFKRWLIRLMALGSVKVLESTTNSPQQGYPIFGLNAVAGYRLSRTHVLSGGLEWVNDYYFKEQLRRWTGHYLPYQQGTLLAGYEFWQGHFSFTAHWGWNLVRPQGYQPGAYQKYGLLYRFANGLTGGIAVKAYGEDTKNFQCQLGVTF